MARPSIAETPVRIGSLGVSRGAGVDRAAGDVLPRLAEDRRPAVERLPAAVADAAEPALADGDPHRAAGEGDAEAVEPEGRGALEHLDHRKVARDVEDDAVACLA